MKTNKYLLPTFALGLLFAANSSFAGTVITNNSGFNANSLAPNDDGSTAAVGLGFSVNFFGTSFSDAFVNNNGNLTFGESQSTFTPFGLSGATVPIIAPFFADVDTRGTGSLTYGTGTFDGDDAFAATWNDVGYYNSQTDKTNDFQVILVDRADVGAGDFDIYFNYDQIQWETGQASSGTDGLGGFSAVAGYSNGDQGSLVFAQLPGSAVNGALLDSNTTTGLIFQTNDGVAGQDLFEVRNGQVITPPPQNGNGVPDSASTAELLGLVLMGLGLAKRMMA